MHGDWVQLDLICPAHENMPRHAYQATQALSAPCSCGRVVSTAHHHHQHHHHGRYRLYLTNLQDAELTASRLLNKLRTGTVPGLARDYLASSHQSPGRPGSYRPGTRRQLKAHQVASSPAGRLSHRPPYVYVRCQYRQCHEFCCAATEHCALQRRLYKLTPPGGGEVGLLRSPSFKARLRLQTSNTVSATSTLVPNTTKSSSA
ncbi:hypothetical protein DFH27DRAFT_3527 [Peziza echinospora]|nr:hypothetical protein DFH27DRAFT_3527 [Peziza echinospora]